MTLALSAVVHLGFGVFVGRTFKLPELDIAFQIPIDVELGMTEEVAVAALHEPVAIEPPAAEPTRAKKPKDAPGADAGATDAAIADASPDDASPDDASAHDAQAGDAALEDAAAGDAASSPRDAGVAEPLVIADAGPPGARLPPGAQIALRIDMERIRKSPIADDMRGLIAVIPDWKALLEGSGIDPVTQLDRLLIMTPNLQREKVALAGRYLGGRDVVDGAVRSLAEARGKEAAWAQKRGLPVAPWENADSTPRVIALVGPAHFTISREEDLERVLSIAAARAKKVRGKSAALGTGSVADGLLAMEEDEGLSLEVEGVEQFVRRGRRGIPARLRVSAIQKGETGLLLRGRLAYADEALASTALEFWQNARDSYARNALVNLLGMGGVLKGAGLVQQGTDVQIELQLDLEQTRLLLSYAREFFSPSR